jgi:hypothetical protein
MDINDPNYAKSLRIRKNKTDREGFLIKELQKQVIELEKRIAKLEEKPATKKRVKKDA